MTAPRRPIDAVAREARAIVFLPRPGLVAAGGILMAAALIGYGFLLTASVMPPPPAFLIGVADSAGQILGIVAYLALWGLARRIAPVGEPPRVRPPWWAFFVAALGAVPVHSALVGVLTRAWTGSLGVEGISAGPGTLAEAVAVPLYGAGLHLLVCVRLARWRIPLDADDPAAVAE